ncbi:hypothetical protein HAX54_001854, partial [Datura stramonium]|nr:hypothetical protein [Datura stramonium]
EKGKKREAAIWVLFAGEERVKDAVVEVRRKGWRRFAGVAASSEEKEVACGRWEEGGGDCGRRQYLVVAECYLAGSRRRRSKVKEKGEGVFGVVELLLFAGPGGRKHGGGDGNGKMVLRGPAMAERRERGRKMVTERGRVAAAADSGGLTRE